MSEIGDLCETRGELTVEWKINDFFSLSKEKDIFYYSPRFYFSGSAWSMKLYPNVETDDKSDRWLNLYVVKRSTGSPVTINFSMSYKTANGELINTYENEKIFNKRGYGWGTNRSISRTFIEDNTSDVVPAGILTIICSLKNRQSQCTVRSLFARLQKLSDDFKQMFRKAKKTDFQIKVEGQNIGAHRLILEARSPVFAAMLSHDAKENQTGEVSIVDLDKSTVETLLNYIYSGDIDKMTTDDAVSIYAAAEKYDLKEVKEICSQDIVQNLSVENVCNVIKFSELYDDKKISRIARDYFKENADKVLETDTWEMLVKENSTLGLELLSTVVKTMFKK